MAFVTPFLVGIGIGTLLLGSLAYLVFCADPNGTGLISRLHRKIYHHLPTFLEKATGGPNSRVQRWISSFFNYLCYTNHPIVQYFYLVIAVGGYVLYYVNGLGPHFPNSQVSANHKWFSAIFAFAAFFTYFLACRVSPGQVTKENEKFYTKKYRAYYDEILYESKRQCTTCKFDKPARSKHCRVCNICVAKFDHHCIWIRQCVGEKNYKHFLSFIGIHSALCLYGFYIGYYCFKGMIQDEKLLESRFRSASGEMFQATWSIVLKYLFFRETMFVFMVALCAIMGLTLLAFFVYHMSLVKQDMTTNERMKRSDIMSFCEKQQKNIKQYLLTPDLSEEKHSEAVKKMKQLEFDYKNLDQWKVSDGLFNNLKRIFSE